MKKKMLTLIIGTLLVISTCTGCKNTNSKNSENDVFVEDENAYINEDQNAETNENNTEIEEEDNKEEIVIDAVETEKLTLIIQGLHN